MSRFLAIWNRAETVIIGLLLVAALCVFLYGSAVRTIAPAYAIDWAEEVAIYLIVWATLLSGGILTSERRHISAELVVSLLPARVGRYLKTAVSLLTFVFCAAMAWLGVQAVMFANMLDERSASTLQTPQAWALYLALPVGMALIVARMLLMPFVEPAAGLDDERRHDAAADDETTGSFGGRAGRSD